MIKEDLKLRQIYFVEEIVLEEPELDEDTYEYEYEPEQDLIATGGTIIRIYDLIGGKLKHIDTVFGSTDQNSKKLVKSHLKNNYKFLKQL